MTKAVLAVLGIAALATVACGTGHHHPESCWIHERPAGVVAPASDESGVDMMLFVVGLNHRTSDPKQSVGLPGGAHDPLSGGEGVTHWDWGSLTGMVRCHTTVEGL